MKFKKDNIKIIIPYYDKNLRLHKLLKSRKVRGSILYKENKKIEKKIKNTYLWDLEYASNIIFNEIKKICIEKNLMHYPTEAQEYLSYMIPMRLKFSNKIVIFLMCDALYLNIKHLDFSVDGQHTLGNTMKHYYCDYYTAIYLQYVLSDFLLNDDKKMLDFCFGEKEIDIGDFRINSMKIDGIKHTPLPPLPYEKRFELYQNHKNLKLNDIQKEKTEKQKELYKNEKKKYCKIYKKKESWWSDRQQFDFYMHIKSLIFENKLEIKDEIYDKIDIILN